MEKLVVKETRDCGNFRVQVTELGDFTIEMVKSTNAPPGSVFLPAKVFQNGMELWSFKGHHAGYKGVARLLENADEWVIALTHQGNLDDMTPIADLPNIKWVNGGRIGGRPTQELISLKEEVARILNVTPRWNSREQSVRDALAHAASKKAAEARAAAQAERDAAYSQKQHERIRRTAEIKGRSEIFVYTQTGVVRHGIPVVGDEWKLLPERALCVGVIAYLNGCASDVIDAFRIGRAKDGALVKVDPLPVSLHNPIAKEDVPKTNGITVHIDFKALTIDGEVCEVGLVGSMEDVRNLSKNGVNGGTLVMAPQKGSPDRYTVYRLVGNEIKTIREVQRRARA